MTCNFHNWPTAHDNAHPVRVRLIARWRRGADGKLECRWVPLFPLGDLKSLPEYVTRLMKLGGSHEP